MYENHTGHLHQKYISHLFTQFFDDSANTDGATRHSGYAIIQTPRPHSTYVDSCAQEERLVKTCGRRQRGLLERDLVPGTMNRDLFTRGMRTMRVI